MPFVPWTLAPRARDDVLSLDVPRECFTFDRVPHLETELHVAGALLFATAWGLEQLSLVDWAVEQATASRSSRLADGVVELESDLFELVLSEIGPLSLAPSAPNPD